jgi:hypothetical protein
MNFIYITQNGYAALIKNDSDHSLDALQRLVGGFVGCSPSSPDFMDMQADVWYNDEFLYETSFSANYVASKMVGCYYYNPICGPAVIASFDNEGNTCGLSDTEIEYLSRKLPLHGSTEIDTNDGKGWTVDEAVYFFGPEVATV